MSVATHRPSGARGATHHDWLDARHSFAFGTYHDPHHMGFRALRVLNEDRIAPGSGFGIHPHRDMEIVTYVVEGALAHRDSLGNAGTIRAGELQAMSAGTGVTHSEANPDPETPVHLLQIWILPDRAGHSPRYAEWKPSGNDTPLTLVASPDGADRSCAIHADARIHAGRLATRGSFDVPANPTRGYWVQLLAGALSTNGVAMSPGDGVAIEGARTFALVGGDAGAHFVLFDLA